MKKMLAFFSWVPGKVAEGRKGEYKTSIYPAWRPPANPVFTPLGGIPNGRRAQPTIYMMHIAYGTHPMTNDLPIGIVERFTGGIMIDTVMMVSLAIPKMIFFLRLYFFP